MWYWKNNMPENKTYTVNIGGNPVKTFTTKEEASKFMVDFMQVQELHQFSLAYVDEAVLKSDLFEANLVLKYIMEK